MLLSFHCDTQLQLVLYPNDTMVFMHCQKIFVKEQLFYLEYLFRCYMGNLPDRLPFTLNKLPNAEVNVGWGAVAIRAQNFQRLKRGLPAEKIAFIHDSNTKAQKLRRRTSFLSALLFATHQHVLTFRNLRPKPFCAPRSFLGKLSLTTNLLFLIIQAKGERSGLPCSQSLDTL